MIAELLARELSAHRWGPKAARLSQAGRHGVPVPQGLCLDTDQLGLPPDQQDAAVSFWLAARRPPVIIVRSSAAGEDQHHDSSAGRFLTVRDVSPSLTAVMAAVLQVSTSMVSGGGSVIIQQQLAAELMGVTFAQPDGSLLTEGSPIAAAVTDGDAPTFRMLDHQGNYTVSGSLDTLPPVLLAKHLRRLVQQLRQEFDFSLDVEWASVAGQLYLLQVRPITAAVGGCA